MGSESLSCPVPMLPLAPARSGQRSPGASSAARQSSRPPPRGSPSTSSVRTPWTAASWASQTAAVDAPAPPHPPVTPSTNPPGSGSWDLPRCSASQAAASGNTATRSAPSAAPNCHKESPSPLRPSKTEGARRRGGSSRTSLPRSTIPAVSHMGKAADESTTVRRLAPTAAAILSVSACNLTFPVTRRTSPELAGSHGSPDTWSGSGPDRGPDLPGRGRPR